MVNVEEDGEIYMVKVRYFNNDDISYRITFSGYHRRTDYSEFISALEPGTYYVHNWEVEFDTPNGTILYTVTDYIELYKKEDLAVFKLKYGYEIVG